MLHVVFYSKMGSEQQAFDIGDVADAICDKLIFRHPHVFGETRAEDAEQVKQNWEDLKLKEKALEHRKKRVLAGRAAQPAGLVKAYRIGEKAAAAGFDWEKREDVWEKVKEETAEVQREIDRSDSSRAEEEFGDLFFALVNAARLYGVDPEAALEKSNRKFIRRFTHIEDRAEQQGRSLRDMTLGQMVRCGTRPRRWKRAARTSGSHRRRNFFGQRPITVAGLFRAATLAYRRRRPDCDRRAICRNSWHNAGLRIGRETAFARETVLMCGRVSGRRAFAALGKSGRMAVERNRSGCHRTVLDT